MEFAGSDEDSIWDAIHVVKTIMEDSMKAKYRVNSTVFLTLQNKNQAQGKIDFAGSVNRMRDETVDLDPKQDINMQHITNIGRLLEANETFVRQELNSIFINKSKQIINTGRLRDDYMTINEKGEFQKELFAAVASNAKNN